MSISPCIAARGAVRVAEADALEHDAVRGDAPSASIIRLVAAKTARSAASIAPISRASTILPLALMTARWKATSASMPASASAG